MTEPKQLALFWCKLFYELIYEERSDVTAYLEELSQREILFPDGKMKKPSLSTLWRKWRAYRSGGYENLVRQPRCDRGQIRTVDQEILAKAIEIKKELPSRSARKINEYIEECYGKTIAPTTMYRHLRHAGATRIKLEHSTQKVRCRWTRDHSNSLWVGDTEDGPHVLIDGRAYPTYLSGFIDVHSRYIVDARYYLRENRQILIDNLLRAWEINGLPRSLYVDNAKIYYCEELQHACAGLEIKLLHRPPREPESGGIIEKFFQSVQSLFESEVRAGDILDLDRLNRTLSAWLSVSYHQSIHSETGETPHRRYQTGLLAKRQVDMDVAVRFFMKRAARKVHNDFSDISVKGRLYRVDHKLRGDTIMVHWDEFSDLTTVLLYSMQGQYLGQGHLHNREQQEQPFVSHPCGKPQHDFLSMWENKHRQQLDKQCAGIDYTNAAQTKQWPFLSFLASMARLLGRKNGTSSFSTTEFEALDKIYRHCPNLNEAILCEAFANAEYHDIVNIAYQLQLIQTGE
jgi:transposase InsO family protein